MIVVLGATGHIGRVVVERLEAAGEEVRALSGHGENAVDAHDRDALREAFGGAERLFLLNPPAPPSTDTVTEEKKTVRALLHAVAETSSLRKVVAQSTYGAAPLDGLGDLGVLWDLEQGLAKLPVACSVIRGAYYMSNWDAQLEAAREQGRIETFFPVDFELPMVAPADIGELAARLLGAPLEETGLFPIEGPRAYSPADVAAAFGQALGRSVEAVVIPREEWTAKFGSLGFSARAAESFVKMMAYTIDHGAELPEAPTRGPTSLEAYVRGLVRNPS